MLWIMSTKMYGDIFGVASYSLTFTSYLNVCDFSDIIHINSLPSILRNDNKSSHPISRNFPTRSVTHIPSSKCQGKLVTAGRRSKYPIINAVLLRQAYCHLAVFYFDFNFTKFGIADL